MQVSTAAPEVGSSLSVLVAGSHPLGRSESTSSIVFSAARCGAPADSGDAEAGDVSLTDGAEPAADAAAEFDVGAAGLVAPLGAPPEHPQRATVAKIVVTAQGREVADPGCSQKNRTWQ
ncbi:hypothetical protein FGL98_11440 [Leekyejoonella antrihumi]|uniref:Uncharacterized protein n=2 Tax=Leekyejoonella antrihumi TaxID=1660198 RepID=A0A563E0L0_9MICO|nr:hypothetical protein FGL98_11440 [Leekyejoonella antrihumi]